MPNQPQRTACNTVEVELETVVLDPHAAFGFLDIKFKAILEDNNAEVQIFVNNQRVGSSVINIEDFSNTGLITYIHDDGGTDFLSIDKQDQNGWPQEHRSIEAEDHAMGWRQTE